VHLVGFITKKFVMMHGHMNVKLVAVSCANGDETSVSIKCAEFLE